MFILTCAFAFTFFCFKANCQESQDTIKIKKKHDPTLASVLSAVIPGSGQIYNKKYWKLPIIYGGMGTLIYFINDNNKQYQKFREAYLNAIDDDPNTINQYAGYLSNSDLQSEMDRWRKFRDLDVIIFAGVYVLNIIDASVDANLFDYDVSDDLSINIQPSVVRCYGYRNTVGLTVKLNLK